MKSKLVMFSFMAVLALGITASLGSAERGQDGDKHDRSGDKHDRDGHDKDGRSNDKDDDDALRSDSRVERGFQISPVDLKPGSRSRALVGLGSYLINAGGACADCHTCPTWAPGHNPYLGQPRQINPTNYLAGGVHFGPFTSANLTPDAHGLPAGLTLDKFIHTVRTGQDPDDPTKLLQVMPWPVYGNLTDRDLKAIYAYLSAIPHAEPGTCGGAGE
jgi:hypothetical protein